MIRGFIKESILKRAQEKGLVEIDLVDIRNFAIDGYGSVDDKPYGGGVGMVMRVDCVYQALEHALGKPPEKRKRWKKPKTIAEERAYKKRRIGKTHTIITSPKGDIHTQKNAQKYSNLEHLVIITGHYEGIDERIQDYVDDEVSGGDVILTGGEIIAAQITDSVVRLIPGVLKQAEAVQEETFFEADVDELISLLGKQYELVRLKQHGKNTVQLLEYPHYTRPEEFLSSRVPDTLLSGNHKDIYEWRMKMAYYETLEKRPDLLY